MLFLKADGTYSVMPRPTSLELIRHAERFGTECVAETAALFMGVAELTDLVAALDRIDAVEEAKKKYSRPLKRRKSAEDRAKEMLGVKDED